MKQFSLILALALVLTLSACAQSAPETTAPGTSPPTAAPQTSIEQTTAPQATAPATKAPPQTTAPAPATVPETTAAPATVPPQTTVPSTRTATLIVSCKIALESGLIDTEKLEILPEDGIILHVKDAEIAEGDTVFDILQRECRANKIHMEFAKTPSLGSAYIEGIGNLYELDGGALSGWVFTVNGEWPGKGSSALSVLPGDIIEWQFTCDLGRDVGAPDAALGGS